MDFLKEKLKKQSKTSIALTILLIIAIIFMGQIYYNEKEFIKNFNDFKKYFTERNEESAHGIYIDIKKQSHKEKVDVYILDQLDAFKYNLENDSIENSHIDDASKELSYFEFYSEKSEKVKEEYTKMQSYVEDYNHYKNGLEAYDKKDFVKAKEEFEKVTSNYKQYNEAQTMAEKMSAKSKEWSLKKCNELLALGDIENALVELEKGFLLNKDDSDLLKEKENIEKNKIEYLKNRKEISGSLEKINKLNWIKDEKSIIIEEVKYKEKDFYKVTEKDEKNPNIWEYELYIEKLPIDNENTEEEKDKDKVMKETIALLIKDKEEKSLDDFIKENEMKQ
ncbi:hypothetical protein [Clostridium senegalense]|uniref:hypothetical protein n=1 Tax=Clostridium senegalense TaxID=1465809 RepID=UPI0002891ADD|nr:hypothetical protein [Clostridium senegalense]